VRVAVVAEFYPRAADPVLGVWAHRQALAARDAGADVRVLVLHRLVPPRAALHARDLRRLLEPLRQPRHEVRDGLEVTYVPFVSPPRWRAYGRWGAWAAPVLGLALRRLRRTFPYDLVHAHYAVPAGDAVRRSTPRVPLVVSVHGGDVLWTADRDEAGRRAVRATFEHARLVLANSAGTARRCEAHGARAVRVVHLGADAPGAPATVDGRPGPTLVSVGHLVARKRHADVVRALWALRDRHRDLRYVVVGDGPEREPLTELARGLGLGERVELRGQLPHAEAVRVAQRGSVFVLPSVDEAFGVAYVEAMAGGVPAIGCRGEDGPEEIAAAGPGLRLVPPGDIEALAAEIDELVSDARHRAELGHQARETALRSFSWAACGRATARAYGDVLAGG
jgi:glycosyltransferase involved in cell wall biosynthesis